MSPTEPFSLSVMKLCNSLLFVLVCIYFSFVEQKLITLAWYLLPFMVDCR